MPRGLHGGTKDSRFCVLFLVDWVEEEDDHCDQKQNDGHGWKHDDQGGHHGIAMVTLLWSVANKANEKKNNF